MPAVRAVIAASPRDIKFSTEKIYPPAFFSGGEASSL
jgi:hypothetical protein